MPDNLKDNSKQTRYRRAILIYRALLTRAGLTPPPTLTKPDIRGLAKPGGGYSGLFSAKLLGAMRASPDTTKAALYSAAADILDVTKASSLTWDKLSNAV